MTLDGIVLIVIWWLAILTIFFVAWVFIPKHRD